MEIQNQIDKLMSVAGVPCGLWIIVDPEDINTLIKPIYIYDVNNQKGCVVQHVVS